MIHSPTLIGRDDLLTTLRREIAKSRNLLLTGPPGIGKSALLQASYAQLEAAGQARAIYVAESAPNKDMLVDIARQLHERFGALPYDQLTLSKSASEAAEDPAQLDWQQLHKPVRRLTVKPLADLVLTAMRQQRYVLFLDHLDRITPTQSAVLQALLAHATVVGATCEKKGTAPMRRLWWAFKKEIAVPPLDKRDVRLLINDYLATHTLLIEHRDMFIRQTLQAAGGNPKALFDILADADKEKTVQRQYIREEIQHEAGVRLVNLAPLSLLVLIAVAASRFISRGMGQLEFYMMLSVLNVVLMFFRPLIMKSLMAK